MTEKSQRNLKSQHSIDDVAVGASDTFNPKHELESKLWFPSAMPHATDRLTMLLYCA